MGQMDLPRALTVIIDCSKHSSQELLLREFSRQCGFPPWFRGTSWDAWIDCMGSIASDVCGASEVRVAPGGTVTIELRGVDQLADDDPKLVSELLACVACINSHLNSCCGGARIALVPRRLGDRENRLRS